MKHLKKCILLLTLLLCGVTAFAQEADSRTAQVVWTEDNGTLTFTASASASPVNVGDTFNGNTVTKVWSGDDVIRPSATPGWVDDNIITADVKTVVFDESFAAMRPTDCTFWFRGMSNLTEIVDLKYLNTSEVNDSGLGHMFRGCSSLKSIDVSNFNTSKVTVTYNMFSGCSSLTTIDVTNFDMSNIMAAGEMFMNCSSLKTIYCNSTWRTIGTADMFKGCTALVGVVPFDPEKTDGEMANPVTGYFTGKWNVNVDAKYATISVDKSSAYTHETVTFTAAPGKYYNIFNGVTVTGERTGNTIELTAGEDGTYTFTMPAEAVTITANTIEPVPFVVWCEGNTTLYYANGKVPQVGEYYAGQEVTEMWCGEQVTNTGWARPGWQSKYNYHATKVVIDETFSTVRPTSCYEWFANCVNVSEIVGLEYLNTSEVTNMNSMFHMCYYITEFYLNTFDMSKVTNASYMFDYCFRLETIYCDSTWNVPTADGMFRKCNVLRGAVAYNEGKVDGNMANPVTGYFTTKWNVNIADGAPIAADGSNWAYTNERVTIVVTDDKNHTVGGITVTGERTGNTVEVTAYEDNDAYTFIMPAEDVTVSAIITGPFAAWCEGDSTLYFDNGENPVPGSTYNGQTVTAVWTGDDVIAYGDREPDWIPTVNTKIKRAVFKENFATVRPTSCRGWFVNCYGLEEIEGLEYFNTENATLFRSMFYMCNNLKTLDLTHFSVTSATDARWMFWNCNSLTTIYCNDTWNIAGTVEAQSATRYMFYQCYNLLGAVAFNSGSIYGSMANPETGYFTGLWDVTVAKTENAAVSADKSKAYTNDTVTITATPDENYRITRVTVTGKRTGNTVELTAGENGIYTFKMPAEAVTVKVSASDSMPLAEALQQEDGTTCRISDDLVVVATAGNHYYMKSATDDTWARIDINTTEPIFEGYTLKDVKGTLVNHLTAPSFTLGSCSLEATDVEVTLQEINLANDFEMPQLSEVVKFTGYYYDGQLRGWNGTGHKGQSLTLDTEYLPDAEFAEGDRYTIVVGIEVKEPWNTSAGAPRRAASSYDYDFQNLIGKVLQVAGHGIITGIEGINADGSDSEIRYYDTSGRYIGSTLDNAPHGIYITSDGRKVRK